MEGKFPLPEEVLPEELCFQWQQSAEKSLKPVLVHRGKELPCMHSLSGLLDSRTDSDIEFSGEVRMSGILASNAVATRYPGNYESMGMEKLARARRIAEVVYVWAENQIRDGRR
jgi:HEPN domain-containing protein